MLLAMIITVLLMNIKIQNDYLMILTGLLWNCIQNDFS